METNTDGMEADRYKSPEAREIHRLLGVENVYGHLKEGDPPVPVDTELVRQYIYKQLSAEDAAGVKRMILTYKAWFDARLNLLVEIARSDDQGNADTAEEEQ